MGLYHNHCVFNVDIPMCGYTTIMCLTWIYPCGVIPQLLRFNMDLPTYSSIFADNHIIYCPLVVNSMFPFSSLQARCCVRTTLGFVHVKPILQRQNPTWVRFEYIRKVSRLMWVFPRVVSTTIKCFNMGISTCGFYHNKVFLRGHTHVWFTPQ